MTKMILKIYGLTAVELKDLSQIEVIAKIIEKTARKNGAKWIPESSVETHARRAESFKNEDGTQKDARRIFERKKAAAIRVAADRCNGEAVRQYVDGTRYIAVAIITDKGMRDLDPIEYNELQMAKLEEAEISLNHIFGRVRIQMEAAKNSRLLPKGIRAKFSEFDQLEECLTDIRDQKSLLEKKRRKLERQAATNLLAST